MSSAAQHVTSRPEPQDVLDYLKVLGYAADPEPDEEVPGIEQRLSTALKGFQKFYELPITGELDEQTLAQVRAPRCGVADPQPGLESTEFGAIWKHTTVTYFCDPVPASSLGVPKLQIAVVGTIDLPRLDDKMFNAIVDQCFAKWAPQCGLTFTRTSDRVNANIVLGFSTSGTLALGAVGDVLGVGVAPPANGTRATLSGSDSTILFDASEKWIPASALEKQTALVKVDGQVFDSVALHEIGHALGLDHSRRKDAVMFPKDGRLTNLSQDDILGIKSRYLQPGTDLEETDDRFDFACGPNDDLFVFKKLNTGSNSSEVHVLSAASNYRNFSLHVGTAMHEVGNDVKFAVASNGDVFVFIPNPASQKTEIHILAADRNYSNFVLHRASVLEAFGNEFRFAVADNRDVFAFKANFGSGKTEIHVLSADSSYEAFSLQTSVNVEAFTNQFFFGVLPNRDVIAVKTRQTGTGQTEAHVLTAASSYTQFSKQESVIFDQLDDRFVVVPKRDGDLLIIQKNGTNSHRTEVHSIRVE